MQLSIPELECAYRHAMAVYGDLEVYVGELGSEWCESILELIDFILC